MVAFDGGKHNTAWQQQKQQQLKKLISSQDIEISKRITLKAVQQSNNNWLTNIGALGHLVFRINKFIAISEKLLFAAALNAITRVI